MKKNDVHLLCTILCIRLIYNHILQLYSKTEEIVEIKRDEVRREKKGGGGEEETTARKTSSTPQFITAVR